MHEPIDALKKHKNWLAKADGYSEKDKLILINKNLSEMNLIKENFSNSMLDDSDLYGSRLANSNFYHASLVNSNFERCDLVNCNFAFSNLQQAIFWGADLRKANFSYAYLKNVDFTGANLEGATFYRANLEGANFSDNILKDAEFDEAINAPYFPISCPDEGSFIGWKKGWAIPSNDDSCNEVIIKLEIPADAHRTSNLSRQCRCDKAKVLEIANLDNTEFFTVAESFHTEGFYYQVGETVYADGFTSNRWTPYGKSHGIFFFINREEAIRYNYR